MKAMKELNAAVEAWNKLEKSSDFKETHAEFVKCLEEYQTAEGLDEETAIENFYRAAGIK